MRYLVTGGGFIGPPVVDQLFAERHEVFILDKLLRGRYLREAHHGSTSLLKYDIRDQDAVVQTLVERSPGGVFQRAAHYLIPLL